MQSKDVHRETVLGTVIVTLEHDGQTVQANCYLPPRGPAVFAVFPDDTPEDKAVDAVVALVLTDGIAPDANLTSQVPGALAAGSLVAPCFRVGSNSNAEGL